MDSKDKLKLLYKVICNTLEDRNKLFEYIGVGCWFHDKNQEFINVYRLSKRESVIYYLFNDNRMLGIPNKYSNENIISVEEYIKIITMAKDRNVEISLEQAEEMYKSGNPIFVNIALKTFPELTNSQFPKSWKELCKIKLKEKGFCINVCGCTVNTEFNDNTAYKTTVSTEERAEKILLLQQLLEIRDYWNKIDEFVPIVDKKCRKYVIRPFDNMLETIGIVNEKYIFEFKTQERAEEFMYIFEKELLQVLSI